MERNYDDNKDFQNFLRFEGSYKEARHSPPGQSMFDEPHYSAMKQKEEEVNKLIKDRDLIKKIEIQSNVINS